MTVPVRVLHVVRPAAGGIRQHVLNLVRFNDQARIAPSIAAPADFLNALPPDFPPTTLLPLEISSRFSLLRDWRVAASLAGMISSHAAIVHTHGLRAGWIAALARQRHSFPFLLTMHNIIKTGALTHMAVPYIARRATRIIAVSHAVAESLIAAGAPVAKISIVPNGIDPARFADLPERIAARREFGVSEEAFVVACIARLSPEKGVDVLLKSARRAEAMTFLIAGDGPERDRLARNAPPHVRFLGRLEDVRTLLAVADALAIPSRQEGQGIAALEALAAGVPVVASRVGGLAEMLADGETALLVPPDDPVALADALNRLQSDVELHRRLIEAGNRLVRERYGISRMIQQVTRIYEEI